MEITELIGYVGSVLVAVSLMMTNVWKLRWINLAGAVFFVIYGVVVKAYPIVAVNAFIALVDAYFIGVMAKQQDYFSLMPVAKRDETFLKGFLDFYKNDIACFFPEFGSETESPPEWIFIFILRNMMPVGLFVYSTEGAGAVDIHLDYVVPEYRDFKSARYLYGQRAGHFQERGLKFFRMRTASKAHSRYLKKVGFSPSEEEPDLYIKKI